MNRPPITGAAELGKSLLTSSVQDVLSSILSDASIGVAITDETGRWLTANAAFCNLLGYALEELKQLDFAAITHPDDRHLNVQLKKDVLNRRAGTTIFEKRYIRKDGQTVWVRLNLIVLRADPTSAAVRFLSLAEDISSAKAAEEALRQRELRFRSLIENALDMIAVIHTDGTFVYLSPSVVKVLGYTPGEIEGHPVSQYVHPDDAATGASRYKLIRPRRPPGSATGRPGGTIR